MKRVFLIAAAMLVAAITGGIAQTTIVPPQPQCHYERRCIRPGDGCPVVLVCR